MANPAPSPERLHATNSPMSSNTDADDPDMTYRRKVNYKSNSLYANLPDGATRRVGFEAGDDITVDVYESCVVIYPEGKDA